MVLGLDMRFLGQKRRKKVEEAKSDGQSEVRTVSDMTHNEALFFGDYGAASRDRDRHRGDSSPR